MEQLFEFMLGASGRINRAKYWKSILIYCFAGLLVGVILMTAAGLAAPLFIIALVVVLIPWLIWGFAIHTERLHDRNKSARWLVAFFLAPGVVGHLADMPLLHGVAAFVLHYILALAACALTVWGFVEIGCLRGTEGPNRYGANPLRR